MTTQDEALKKYFTLSAGAHLIIFSMLFLKAVFFPEKNIKIRNVIKVDMIGLPEKNQPKITSTEPIKEKPKPQPKPAAKKAKPKIKPIAKTKNLESAQKNALNKLKALSAIEKIRQKMAEKERQKQQPVLGNKINKGNALTGLDKLDYQDYSSRLNLHVKQYWSLPQWLANAKLKAVVRVRLDKKGMVTDKQVLASSGNDVFDSRALKAVEEASPFPLPPDRLVSYLSTVGFDIGFPD